jgi:hypothetical protein
VVVESRPLIHQHTLYRFILTKLCPCFLVVAVTLWMIERLLCILGHPSCSVMHEKALSALTSILKLLRWKEPNAFLILISELISCLGGKSSVHFPLLCLFQIGFFQFHLVVSMENGRNKGIIIIINCLSEDYVLLTHLCVDPTNIFSKTSH